MIVRCESAEFTRAFGAAVAPLLRAGDVLVLVGDLGTGKTTFTQGVARALGVDVPVTSPTFALVNQYEAPLPVTHIDVYRLDRMQEVHDLGFDEMIDDGRVTLIEWGDRIAQVLPADRLVLRFAFDDDHAPDTRMIEVQPHGASWASRLDELAALARGREAH